MNKKIVTSTVLIATISLSLLGYINSKEKVNNIGYESLVQEVSSVYPDYSLEELKETSDLIIEGNFKDYSKEFRVRPTNGGDDRIFKDAKIEVTKVFKGNVKEGDIVSIRTMGGQHIDRENKIIYSTVNKDEINFESNKDVLLFLYKPTGGTYNTKGNYYQLLSESQSVFNKENDQYLNYENPKDIINYEQLNIISSFMETESREEKQMLDNLNNGQITQQEYEQWIKDKNNYATILD